MITKYNTGDEVLIPVKIQSAMSFGEKIAYTIRGSKGEDELIPEEKIFSKEDTITSHQTAKVNVNIDCAELDEVKAKIERLTEIAKEASSLFDELAEREVRIRISSIRA